MRALPSKRPPRDPNPKRRQDSEPHTTRLVAEKPGHAKPCGTKKCLELSEDHSDPDWYDRSAYIVLETYDEEKLSMRMMNEKWESEKVKVVQIPGLQGSEGA